MSTKKCLCDDCGSLGTPHCPGMRQPLKIGGTALRLLRQWVKIERGTHAPAKLVAETMELLGED